MVPRVAIQSWNFVFDSVESIFQIDLVVEHCWEGIAVVAVVMAESLGFLEGKEDHHHVEAAVFYRDPHENHRMEEVDHL